MGVETEVKKVLGVRSLIIPDVKRKGKERSGEGD
jgi:hypothetical protein